VRPEKYPASVLWNYKDLESDPDVKIDPQNPSRPPLHSVIRHEDGSLVDIALFDAIRASGRSLVVDVLFPLIPNDKASRSRSRTKKLFTELYRAGWNKAVHQYEVEQPLLALCTGHWKAEHMLQSILLSLEAKASKDKKKVKKGKGKSKASESIPLANVSDVDLDQAQDSPSLFVELETDPTTNSQNNISSKRARASSSTPKEPQPLKKTKPNEPSRGGRTAGSSTAAGNSFQPLSLRKLIYFLIRSKKGKFFETG
jgi:hypothetical protein